MALSFDGRPNGISGFCPNSPRLSCISFNSSSAKPYCAAAIVAKPAGGFHPIGNTLAGARNIAIGNVQR